MSESKSETTLYKRIGGEAAIRAAVNRFYERVLADPSLRLFFNGVGMPRLKGHQFAFLSQSLGGPKQYSGSSMNEAHARLAIEQYHFDSVAVHLVETLRELGVPEDIVGEVATAITPLSSQVVNTPKPMATA
jgi:hemoglobin